MYTIPKELIKKWDRIKRELIPTIEKDRTIPGSAASKKQMKESLTKLLGEFDQGLKAKMKTAANAKTDAEARKAAQTVANVAEDYRKSVQAAAKRSGLVGTYLPAEFRGIDDVLTQISLHAQASAKSRPPITFAQELDDIMATFKQTMAGVPGKVDALGNATADEKTALRASAKNLIDELDDGINYGLSGPVATAKKAGLSSEVDLRRALVSLGTHIDNGRKYARAWARKVQPPSAGSELVKSIDFALLHMGRKVTGLISQLDQASR